MRWLAAHDLVERVGDLAGEAGLVAGQAHGEVAVAHRLQRAQQLAHVDIVSAGGTISIRRLAVKRFAVRAGRRRACRAGARLAATGRAGGVH